MNRGIKTGLGTVVAFVTIGCGAGDVTEPVTYHGTAKAIIDAKCAGCHQPDEIGPFSLQTYEEVVTFKVAAKAAIMSGNMPPWQPADGCTDYKGNFDLTETERATLLEFFDAPEEGDPSVPAQMTEATARKPEWRPDLSLPLPLPFTPKINPDDYRCQIIEWPLDKEVFVTGFSVTPDKKAIVHHAIAFLVSPGRADQFRAMDEAEEGPGYTCFGGPTAASVEGMATLRGQGDTGWLGAWVPGARSGSLPEGLGIKVVPGSIVVLQMHYNTLSAETVADQSTVNVSYAETVEREAMILPFTDVGWVSNGRIGGPPMTIPAGESSVSHSAAVLNDGLLMGNFRNRLGVSSDQSLLIYNAAGHMHTLGQKIRLEVERPSSGNDECLLEIQDWDFNWQGTYMLEKPVRLAPEDNLRLSCTWDNSASNQIMVNGALRTPTDIKWGEGTTDEMCLGVALVAAE
ncbi:MAG: hypothetical protein VYC39_11805 [Myxococcota bacterium]|nr:hypothetical protein [Myxococcota bacterium]